MLTVDQVFAAQKTQFGTVFGASAKVLDGIEKLARLNLQTGRAALDEAAESCRAVIGMSDPQQLFALQQASVEPTAARWTGYAGEVYAIVAATGAELRQIAEQTAAETQSGLLAAVESALKNAPAGSENATALVKSAFVAANTAFDNLQNTVRQVSDAANAQVETLTQRATSRGKRAG